MVAYKHLLPDPVFECDGLHYARLGGRRAVVLKHIDGTPISGFQGQWRPVFLYDGLAGMYLLALEEKGAKASWFVAPDGRRLGDKLADLTAEQRRQLRDGVVARGLGAADGLIGDGLQFIDAKLRGDILGLAGAGRGAAVLSPALAMLSAPHKLQMHLRYRPGEQRLRLGEGWSVDAAVTARAIGRLSTAHADPVPPAARILLTLALAPADPPGDGQPVEIEIAVNGGVLGTIRLHPHWQVEGADFAFWLPPERVGGRRLQIAFRHSGDFMLTALRIECGRIVPLAGLEAREVMLRFENIGDNCEFGLVQRQFGAEPVGLLRFAGLRNPRRLVRFLEDDFGSFGDPGSLGVAVIGGEYWIVDHVYGIAYHTFRYPHEVAAEEVIRENEIKASYLKRKFREDLEDGEKILVYKRVVTQDPHEMLALHAALNRFGTVNRLLWVTEADTNHAVGDVEWIGERLLKGYIGRISLENANDFDAETWLLLCRNALAAFEAVRPVSAL